jgi:pimeloyl-ACP methyl ester carboxylesterase
MHESELLLLVLMVAVGGLSVLAGASTEFDPEQFT